MSPSGYDLGAHLERVQLLDCTGHPSHTLTLCVDGTVEVHFREGYTALIDPVTRTVLTPGMAVHADIIEAAATLRPPT